MLAGGVSYKIKPRSLPFAWVHSVLHNAGYAPLPAHLPDAWLTRAATVRSGLSRRTSSRVVGLRDLKRSLRHRRGDFTKGVDSRVK
jgi:hypothetical protein